MARLVTTRAPQLPIAPLEYSNGERDRYSNILRLYFNQIDNLSSGLLEGDGAGGKYLRFPYAAIQRTTDKTFTANTATEITFDQNDYLNACENDGTNGITVLQPGIYNYQFSVQFANSAAQDHDAWIWLRVNGTDVTGTASQFTIPSKHGAVDGHLIGAANFFVELQANEYVQMMAAVSDVTVSMQAYAAQAAPFVMPAIPSVAATLSFVSNLAT